MQPLFMISIAAELAAMHPQTLRMYERRGLLQPRRSAKNTRLYSQADVERLRRIQELTDLGLNLAGVERVLRLEEELAAALAQVARLQAQVAAASEQLRAETTRVERSLRHDLVATGTTAIVRVERRRGR
jgi:MerR family transcriptional regulator, heat shock protein HspR